MDLCGSLWPPVIRFSDLGLLEQLATPGPGLLHLANQTWDLMQASARIGTLDETKALADKDQRRVPWGKGSLISEALPDASPAGRAPCS